MFTGIVECTGILQDREMLGDAGKLTIATHLAEELEHGGSIAVNGTCLSAETIDPENQILTFHTMAQTLNKTNLGTVPVGNKVNLERPLKMGDRLGGHLVMGHVDGTADVRAVGRQGDDWIVDISIPEDLKMLIIDKGSIALDGISLTVAELHDDFFRVCIIPITLELTNICEYDVGTKVNLEMDMVGKYVLRREELTARS